MGMRRTAAAALAILVTAQVGTSQPSERTLQLANTEPATTSSSDVAQQESTTRTPTPLRINQVTTFGTHNSYHVPPPDKVLNFLEAVDKLSGNSKYYPMAQLEYLPISEQLAQQNVRSLEIDLYWDPNGGLYADPVGPKMPDIDWIATLVDGSKNFWDKVVDAFKGVGSWMKEHLNPANWFRAATMNMDPMKTPGWKVFHRNDFDYMSSCRTFIDCLEQMKLFHDQNPRHWPITVSLNVKDNELDNELRSALSGPFMDFLQKSDILPVSRVPALDFSQLIAAEQEVLKIFKREDVFTPNDLRGAYPTVLDAVRANNWPLIDDALGKFIFILDGGEPVYRAPDPVLKDRLFFTYAPPGTELPDTAFILANDPMNDDIAGSVQKNFMVRARGDGVPLPSDPNALLAKAIWSGAHMILTDAPAPGLPGKNAWAQGYTVLMGERCNPYTCHEPDCPIFVPGGWSEWSAWEEGECQGPTCPTDRRRSEDNPRVRSRACTSPPPTNGGKYCDGEATIWENCPTRTCARKGTIYTEDVNAAYVGAARSADEESSNTGLIIGLSVALGLVLLGVIAALAAVYFRRRMAAEPRQPKSSVVIHRDSTGSNDVIVTPYVPTSESKAKKAAAVQPVYENLYPSVAVTAPAPASRFSLLRMQRQVQSAADDLPASSDDGLSETSSSVSVGGGEAAVMMDRIRSAWRPAESNVAPPRPDQAPTRTPSTGSQEAPFVPEAYAPKSLPKAAV